MWKKKGLLYRLLCFYKNDGSGICAFGKHNVSCNMTHHNSCCSASTPSLRVQQLLCSHFLAVNIRTNPTLHILHFCFMTFLFFFFFIIQILTELTIDVFKCWGSVFKTYTHFLEFDFIRVLLLLCHWYLI